MDHDPAPPTPAASDRPVDLVPFCNTHAAVNAHLIREVLETAGISAFILGEHSAAHFEGLTNAAPVSIHVQRGDYDRAVDALHQRFEENAEEARDELAGHCPFCGYALHGLQGQERCPECGGKILKWEALRRSIVLAPPPSMGGSTVPQTVIWMMAVVVVAALVGATIFCVAMF